MKTAHGSCLRITLYSTITATLIAIPVLATWAPTITQEEVNVWKMWINLAINGYAEPMRLPGEKPWWKWWE